ncbi:MAG: DoxX family protein [Chlamydiota bacterium]
MLTNPFLHWTEKFYNFIIKIGSNLQSLFLLYMRLTWGHQFFITGLGKLGAIDKVTQFFTTLQIPHPHFHAYLVGSIEAICGFLLFFGFASRLAAIPLIFIMFTALGTAHAHNLTNFLFITNPLTLVRQEPYPFLITALLVFIFGPGRISVDAWIKRWLHRQPRY